jgi:hypothetical protein
MQVPWLAAASRFERGEGRARIRIRFLYLLGERKGMGAEEKDTGALVFESGRETTSGEKEMRR